MAHRPTSWSYCNLRPPEVAGHFRDSVETARACRARSKTHSPLISSRLMQRRACPAPTVGVGHARLFATTRINFSFRGPSLVFITLLWAVGPLRQVVNPVVNLPHKLSRIPRDQEI